MQPIAKDLSTKNMSEALEDFFDVFIPPAPQEGEVLSEDQLLEHKRAEEEVPKEVHEIVRLLYTDQPFGPGLWHNLTPAERRAAAARWDEEQSPERRLEHTKAWFDVTLDAGFWWKLASVSPREAALLLCQLNPNDDLCDQSLPRNEETGPEDYRKLLRLFQDVQKMDPTPRQLEEWVVAAESAGLKYHSWIKEYSHATNGRATKDNAAPTSSREDGMSRREKQIRAIETATIKLGYARLSIPDGGKKQLLIECKESRKDLFGSGDDPFLDAWKDALNTGRIRMANHRRYSRK